MEVAKLADELWLNYMELITFDVLLWRRKFFSVVRRVYGACWFRVICF